MAKTVKEILNEVRGYGMDYLSKFDPKTPAGYLTDRDIPTVIILKRKAIRVFPDNQKIALYYSQALDKYISIPYGKNNKAAGMHLSETKDDNSNSYYAARYAQMKKDAEQHQTKIKVAQKSSSWKVARDPNLSKVSTAAIMQTPGSLAAKAGALTGMTLLKGVAGVARGIGKLTGLRKKENAPTSKPETETKPTGGSNEKVFAGGKFIGYEKDLSSSVLKNRGAAPKSETTPVKEVPIKKPKEVSKPIRKRPPGTVEKIIKANPEKKYAKAAIEWASKAKPVGPK